IQTRNVELSESMRQMVEEKVAHVGRFLEGMERAEVRFVEERNPRIADKEICEVTLHGHGHVVRARATAADAPAAVDRVVDKLEHRLTKLKGKLVGRSHPRRANDANGTNTTNGTNVMGLAGPELEIDEDGAGPRIVRTKQFAIKPMTPAEGALQMELLGHSFFLFTNADTGGSSVVYRRDDGDIGLIDAS
ncbi:MAG: ribosome hibernation-promoting factor, HPF/YfiA family, partial [Acidimicrobiales bacterium]